MLTGWCCGSPSVRGQSPCLPGPLPALGKLPPGADCRRCAQVVLELLDDQVRQGSRVYESGHTLVLAWCENHNDEETIQKLLSQVGLRLLPAGACMRPTGHPGAGVHREPLGRWEALQRSSPTQAAACKLAAAGWGQNERLTYELLALGRAQARGGCHVQAADAS